jgi:hypothetical protein
MYSSYFHGVDTIFLFSRGYFKALELHAENARRLKESTRKFISHTHSMILNAQEL